MFAFLTIVCFILAIVSLVGVLSGMAYGDAPTSLILFVLFVMFTYASVGSYNIDMKASEKNIQYKLTNHIYEKEVTLITGIFKNKITTKDGTDFYITDISKFTDVSSLKLEQKVEIEYINGVVPVIINLTSKDKE